MDDNFIIAAYSVIADTLQSLGHESHPLAQVSDPEVLTVAVVAAKYFQNYQERALCVMVQAGYVSAVSVSRYNRRLHALTAWLEGEGVLGDKGYIGSAARTPKRKGMKGEDGWEEWMDRARKQIESSFSSLVRSLTLHGAQVKTFWSLRTRVNLKIAALNLLHSGVLFR